jgi:CheY-like chemotaxis protein
LVIAVHSLAIILCTGYNEIMDEPTISQNGIQGHMVKPINSKELIHSIEELLESI